MITVRLPPLNSASYYETGIPPTLIKPAYGKGTFSLSNPIVVEVVEVAIRYFNEVPLAVVQIEYLYSLRRIWLNIDEIPVLRTQLPEAPTLPARTPRLII